MAGKIRDINNPVVFFDLQIGTYKAGRVKMELFADVVPKVKSVIDSFLIPFLDSRKF